MQAAIFAFDQHSEAVGAHLRGYALPVWGYWPFCAHALPIITAVNGVTAGGGLAFLGFPSLFWPQIGSFCFSLYKSWLEPDGSSTWYLPRLIGIRRTQNSFS